MPIRVYINNIFIIALENPNDNLRCRRRTEEST